MVDYLSSEGIGAVSLLYLWLSTRWRFLHFRKFNKKIGADNIFRVYHGADPVSMIPIFPIFIFLMEIPVFSWIGQVR